MSILVTSSVVFGFPVEREEVRKEEKRFNEKTGEPYMKQVFDYNAAVIGSYVFNKEDSDSILEEEGYENLDCIFSDSDKEEGVLGIIVSQTGNLMNGGVIRTCDAVNPINPSLIELTEKTGLTPELFLVSYVG